MPARLISAVVLAAAAWAVPGPANAQQAQCETTPEGRVCKVQQPLVNGTPVDLRTQKDLGLVTVDGNCSGTLLNRFWVLTADHCVSMRGQLYDAQSKRPQDMRITAAWSPTVVTPTRLERRWYNRNPRLDIALIYLGAGDFGHVNIQLLLVGVVDSEMTLTKYGRGISAFATGTNPMNAVAAVSDQLYRSARFRPSNASATSYSMDAPAAASAIANGGDSGGPDIATAPNGIGFGIAGVQSTCSGETRVPGMPSAPPDTWTWVTRIASCSSVAINTIRHEIVEIIQEGRIPCPGASAGCAIPPTSYLLVR